MLNNCITFINILISSIEDMHKITYTKGHVKSWTCYLTIEKKSKTIFRSQFIASKEDENQTCSYETKGGGGEELQTMAIQGNLEE